MMSPLRSADEARTLALEIVNTIPDPFLVLDSELRVEAASRSFYDTFRVDVEHTLGCKLYSLGDGQWDIPALRLFLETIISEHVAMDGFEVEQDFPIVGHRVMLLSARLLLSAEGRESTILLAFKDVTANRGIEREKQKLLIQAEALSVQNRILLQELQHRVGNSLQIIASILHLKARSATSPETRRDLEDAYERVMSVALVQSHLGECEGMTEIEIGAFLSKLCGGLASSMTEESHPIAIDVLCDDSMIASSKVVSIGLIVTELVINAVKYAFPNGRRDARILVAYETQGSAWKLTVSDNGVGKAIQAVKRGSGLGTMIVDSLVKQLGASVETASGTTGVSVSVVSPTFEALLPQAA